MAPSVMTRAALIGLGMVAGTYGDAFRKSRSVSLASIYARRLESRAAFLEAFPDLGASEAESVEAIAADPAIDFAIVATPPNARTDVVAALSRAGKHVLMEKPVERSLEKARELVELCEESGVTLGIVLQHRARPIVADLRRALPSLGPLMVVEATIPWWRPQAYYDQPGRGTFERDGGGVLISQAIHTLDLMLSLTGPVSDVTAMCATSRFHQIESEDFVSAGLSFVNGAVGQLFATTASFPGRGETIILHGQDGSAHLEAGMLRIERQDGTSQTIGRSSASGAGADPMAFTSDWHRAIIEDFADAIDKTRPPLVSGRDALEAHRLITALERSGGAGRRIAMEDI